MNNYRYSFCTSCMGRLHDLKKTYLPNIELTLKIVPKCTFTLLNWNSGDGMHDWVETHLKQHINSGVVNYIVTRKPERFSQAVTKNITMKNSTGDVVCNLDADNFIQPQFLIELLTIFNRYENPVVAGPVHHDSPIMKGVAGRIACRRDSFIELRGFDERMTGWGYEDIDYIDRFEIYFDVNRHIFTEEWLSVSDGCRHITDVESQSNKKNEQHSLQKIQRGEIVNDVDTWGVLPA